MTNIATLPEHDRYVATLAERAEQRLLEQRQAAEPQPTAGQLIDRYGPALVLEAAAMIAELAKGGVLRAGTNQVHNGTGRPERVVRMEPGKENEEPRQSTEVVGGEESSHLTDPEQLAQVRSVAVLVPDGAVRESLASDPFAESATADPEQPAGDTLGEARVLDRYAAVYPTREDG